MITFNLLPSGKILVNQNGSVRAFDNNVVIEPSSEFKTYIVIKSPNDIFQFDASDVVTPASTDRMDLILKLSTLFFVETIIQPDVEVVLPTNYGVNRGIITKSIAANVRNSVISLRLKLLHNSLPNNTIVIPSAFSVYSTDQAIFFELVHQSAQLNETLLNGNPTWNNIASGSACEFALNGTTTNNLGKTIYSGYCDEQNNFNIILPDKIKILLNTAKTQSDILHLLATPIGKAGTLYGTINFTEIYE